MKNKFWVVIGLVVVSIAVLGYAVYELFKLLKDQPEETTKELMP